MSEMGWPDDLLDSYVPSLPGGAPSVGEAWDTGYGVGEQVVDQAQTAVGSITGFADGIMKYLPIIVIGMGVVILLKKR